MRFIMSRSTGLNISWRTSFPSTSFYLRKTFGHSFSGGFQLRLLGYSQSFRYRGSLPFPPCSEGAIWTVLKKGAHIAIKQFRKLKVVKGLTPHVDPDYPLLNGNYRPLQPVNNRTIWENFWHERQLELREGEL